MSVRALRMGWPNFPALAILIRLRAPQRDQQAFCGEAQILNIQKNDFRATGRAGKADQKQCAIPDAEQILGQHTQHQAQILGQHGGLLLDGCSMRALDTLQCLGDELVVFQGRRIPRALVRLADRGQMVL
jgi:hypothetical protein